MNTPIQDNAGTHQPTSRNDAPAARYMLWVVLVLLVLGTLLSVFLYNHYNGNRPPDGTEQVPSSQIP